MAAVVPNSENRPPNTPFATTPAAKDETSSAAKPAVSASRSFISPAVPKVALGKLNRAEFEAAVRKMGNFKATGPDDIPAELIKHCKDIKELLFYIVQRIWEEEQLPPGFALANFVMLYKNKGSSDDPSKYRCITLLNHAYKILSHIILKRLTAECENFLEDWQTGFRQHRGCRDNTMVLRTLVQRVMQLGQSAETKNSWGH